MLQTSMCSEADTRPDGGTINNKNKVGKSLVAAFLMRPPDHIRESTESRYHIHLARNNERLIVNRKHHDDGEISQSIRTA